MYDERPNSVIVSAAGLREQAESLENKVQLLRFSEIGALEAEIRRIKDEVEANSRSVIDIEGTIARERTIRGNVETYIQHLVPATDLRQFSDRMSGALNEHSQKHDEHKLQLSCVARCVKDLHDRSQGPNPKDMQAQFMKLVLRVNEINMQLTKLRERPPAAHASPSGGAASGARAGSWEKSGDTDSLVQGRVHRGSPPRAARAADSARPRLLLLDHLHHHRLRPFLAGIPLEPRLGLLAMPLTEVAANPSAKTVLTMISTHVSSVAINFPAAAHAEEEEGGMVFRHVSYARRTIAITRRSAPVWVNCPTNLSRMPESRPWRSPEPEQGNSGSRSHTGAARDRCQEQCHRWPSCLERNRRHISRMFSCRRCYHWTGRTWNVTGNYSRKVRI